MVPDAVAVARVDDDQRVRILSVNRMKDGTGWDTTVEYAKAVVDQYGAWVAQADVSTLGSVQRRQLEEAIGHHRLRETFVSERIKDLAGRSIRTPARIIEVTSYMAALIDGRRLRLIQDHDATAATNRFQARQQRPEQDEQRFEENPDYALVMSQAMAVGMLDPYQQSEVFTPIHHRIPRTGDGSARATLHAASGGNGIVHDFDALVNQARREFWGYGRGGRPRIRRNY